MSEGWQRERGKEPVVSHQGIQGGEGVGKAIQPVQNRFVIALECFKIVVVDVVCYATYIS